MAKSILFLTFLFIGNLSFTQLKEETINYGIQKLQEGENMRAYLLFKKAYNAEKKDATLLAYMSLSISRICYKQDTIKPEDIFHAKNYAEECLAIDSTLVIGKIAKAFSLLLECETMLPTDIKCSKLATIDGILSGINIDGIEKSLQAEIVNLKAVVKRMITIEIIDNEGLSCTTINPTAKEIINLHDKALEKEQTNLRFLFEKGLSYEVLGMHHEATEIYQKAVKIDATSEEAKRFRFLITEKIGY